MFWQALQPERYDPRAETILPPSIHRPRNSPLSSSHVSERHLDEHSPVGIQISHPGTHLREIGQQSIRINKTKALIAIERYSHFKVFPRLSISLSRYHSAAVAKEAFERATLMSVVTLFASCWALFSWSRKSRISNSLPVEGAHFSATIADDPPAEDPPTTS
jgi:hypothetical protein